MSKVTRPCCASTTNDHHEPGCPRLRLKVGIKQGAERTEFDLGDAVTIQHLLAKIADNSRSWSDRCFAEGAPHSGVHWSIIDRGMRKVLEELAKHNRA
jgi:hypothetical protein